MSPKRKEKGIGKSERKVTFAANLIQKDKIASRSNISRIWKEEDEKILLQALVVYSEQHKELPNSINWASFLSNLTKNVSPLSFEPDINQLTNKFRVFKSSYKKSKMNPSSVKDGHPKYIYISFTYVSSVFLLTDLYYVFIFPFQKTCVRNMRPSFWQR